jgi:hypothetical protein
MFCKNILSKKEKYLSIFLSTSTPLNSQSPKVQRINSNQIEDDDKCC